jgi:hypothetical protein
MNLEYMPATHAHIFNTQGVGFTDISIKVNIKYSGRLSALGPRIEAVFIRVRLSPSTWADYC